MKHRRQKTNRNRARLNYFLICVVLLTSILCINMISATRYEYYNTGDDSITGTGLGAIWKAQTFTVGTTGTNENFDISNISAKLYRIGNPENCYLSIRAVNASGYPTGSDLAVAIYNCNSLTTSTNGEWINVTVNQSYTLEASTQYALVIRTTAGDGSNYIGWKVDDSSASYTGGTRYKTSNSGVTWDEENYGSGNDVMFEIYGSVKGAEINLISPSDNTVSSNSTLNFISYFNITGTNLNYTWRNATFNIWKDGIIFNSTTINLSGNNTKYTLQVNNFELGDYKWNILGWYGNNTYNTNVSATNNYSFEVGATIINQVYSSNTYETSKEIFIINLNILSSVELNLAKLIYNNISYDVYNITYNSGNITLYKIIDIPLNTNPYANQTNYFYWQFNYNGGFIQNLSNQEQESGFINLQQCNTTYNTQSLNFTFYDELNQININTSSNPATLLLNFKYWLGDGNIKKLYNFQTINSTNNSYVFCLYPNNTLQIDMDIEYKSYEFADRTFYLRNYSIYNIVENILLYNLDYNEATKFSINLKQGTEVFTDAVVGIWKYFVGLGNYRLTMVGITDDKGKFSANLDLDQSYNFTINKDGINYGGFLKQASCLSSPCEIDINIGEIVLSGFKDLENYFAQNIEYNLTYNKSSSIVTLNFADKLGTANYWRLFVYKNNYDNDSLITICDKKSYSISGTLTCNYTGYLGDINVKTYISRSPELLVDFINFVNENSSTIFGISAILASIIIILVIFFGGTRNPAIALILIPFSLVLLKFIGFIPFSWGWIGGITIFIVWLMNKINT